MKLKSISIAGFKTFADRVNLVFNDGITGIQGPNGCGKSNVVNALRWAFGEQNAQNFRDPEEVIFSGADKRKQLSMAEVTVTFTNDGVGCPPEYLHLPEVSIKRRIFRDGTREYYMNNELCRLKDITDFLLAMGVTSRGYSIVEQEKRDRIINSTPESMRDVLEETAGITVFKQHRADAEKRLRSTDEELEKLGGMEHEFRQQLVDLEEQVRRCETKRNLSTGLRETRIRELCIRTGHWRSEAKKLQETVASLRNQLETADTSNTQWQIDANNLKADQTEIVTKTIGIRKELDTKRTHLAALRERESNRGREAQNLAERKQTLEKSLGDERVALQEQEALLKQCQEKIDGAQRELATLDGVIGTLEEQIEEEREALRVHRNQGSEIQSEVQATRETLSQLRFGNQNILATIERANSSLKRNREQAEEQRRVRGQQAADRDVLKAQLDKLSAGMKEVADAKARIDDELASLQSHLNDCRSKRDAAKEELMTTNASLSGLQKLQSANEGLSDGAKALRSKLATSIQGFLFENFTAHPADESLLERALPELLEAALVTSPDTLVDILDKMEEQDLTRVAFVVPELTRPLSPAEEAARDRLLSQGGIRNVGLRLVSASREEAAHLFSRVFIVRDEWTMFEAQRLAGPEATGFLFISERGAVQGGFREIMFGRRSEGDASGLLQRKRQIAELEEKLKSAQKQLATQEGELYQVQEKIKALEEEAHTVQTRVLQEREEVVRITGQVNSFEATIKTIDDQLRRIENEMAGHDAEIKAEQERYQKNQAQIDALERELRQYQTQLEDYQSTLEDLQENVQTLDGQLSSKRNARAIAAERAENQRFTYEQARTHVARYQQNADRTQGELNSINEKISQGRDDAVLLAREVESLAKAVHELDSELSTLLDKEAAISEQLRVIENSISASQRQKDLRQNELGSRSLDLQRIQTLLETAENEARENFGLSPTDLPNEAPPNSPSPEKLDREIKKLEKELAELGAVNERAAEDYRIIEEKLTFLETQRVDIISSKERIETAIASIEGTTRERFQEVYTRVNDEFQKLFPMFFRGGEAQLVLTKPEDLLTTGVQVMVRLPGKTPKPMRLFSGGEKALTAASLIFALLKTHPTPFCFLDEVDAPLDEGNVSRYAEVLETFRSQFQFVVISHRRDTQAAFDQAYQVVMQADDPGVSKLFSLDLSNLPGHLQKKKASPRAGASASSQQPVASGEA